MEGVTGRIYRRVHSRLFPGIDKYYAPFFSPTETRRIPPKYMEELRPENNEGVPLVPQLLANSADNFIWAARELRQMGYEEVNLNLGCPSGTVTAKKKGAGLLKFPDELDAMLGRIFSSDVPRISVKTRVGFSDPAELERLMEIFGRYPVYELTVHPRVREDFYKNKVRLDAYEYACGTSAAPPVYNGDIFTAADCAALLRRFPQTPAVMIGRGLAANPALARQIKTGERPGRETQRAFHDALFDAYAELLYGDVALLHKMKEVWSYMICLFNDDGRHSKRLRKAKDRAEYAAAAAAVFDELELLADARGVK
ncbi:MAG: tRNA-dihydrouridine synthase family protein [Oscillospiraceae bacterium]|nr:tRNA-dihydrouridine synthase family protein [Oscillospiraceae bacterium]